MINVMKGLQFECSFISLLGSEAFGWLSSLFKFFLLFSGFLGTFGGGLRLDWDRGGIPSGSDQPPRFRPRISRK